MKSHDPEILIAGCLAGDRKCQEQLFRLLYDFAMRIALRYTRNSDEAADIMSGAFVKVFRSLETFDREKGTIYAWLKKIVINEAIDQIKKRNLFTTIGFETVAEPVIDSEYIQKADAFDLLHEIRKLPPATHTVFLLFAVDGYSHKEIARQLGIKTGTSKWHLSEARKMLQKKLQTK